MVSSKKIKSVIQAEEEHLASVSTKKVTRKKITKVTSVESTSSEIKTEMSVDSVKESAQVEALEGAKKANGIKKTKSKSKKTKSAETDTQNISVKKSFSKFDELQKKNLIHNSNDEKDTNCRACAKPVYKMEEIKAEKSIFHKNCFRCKECSKALKVDTYQSHEGELYCIMHFKMLLAPKTTGDFEQEKPRKAELIIRENEPKELPPDVVRASNKPDLGLEELQQLNVRSRFEIFENGNFQKESEKRNEESSRNPVKKSASIVSKLARLQQHGCFVGEKTGDLIENAELSEESEEENEEDMESDDDMDLVRSKKCTQKERPIGLGDAMNDIKSRFESGHMMTKEERREERKQEIQNIRSRLFMGKQARIKEMYQQAVAEAETSITSAEKKPNIDAGCAASTIKERFEKGEMFKEANNSQGVNEKLRNGAVEEDAEVFESAISKKSRSIFMELDANVAANKNHNAFVKRTQSITSSKRLNSESEQENMSQENVGEVVKYDEKPEDVKIETSEISQKFKFFETFRPQQTEKKQFRITPPREGVVKLPTPDSDEEMQKQSTEKDKVLEKSQTTSKMLNKFREMEQNKFNHGRQNEGPRPLKCFTPPPDGEKRVYQDQESDFDSEEDEEDNEDNSDEETKKSYDNDSALREAQLAARAKVLRAKFEKWQSTETDKGENGAPIDIYSQQGCDDTSIESTKALRERFENINKVEQPVSRTRYQVNRFV